MEYIIIGLGISIYILSKIERHINTNNKELLNNLKNYDLQKYKTNTKKSDKK
jgi:divalent metal cation (Fe/Co/Zn/Cd) transporter